MLCERCQQRQATVHMQQFINGEKTERHLCQECAGTVEIPISFDNFFQSFLDAFVAGSGGNVAGGKTAKSTKACSSCGLTYDGFKKAGRLGCASCYEVFHNEMDAIFKNVQGSAQHQGKYPRKNGAELQAKRELEQLKLMLAKAVENEEYEEAAKLRDQIKMTSCSE